ncbi:MAG: helix-turn-helix domain-containing protein [Acidobacteriota bacterium]
MRSKNDSPTVIRTARAVEGWTQSDLADRLRTAPSTISRAEREGAEPPPPSLMERISAATEGRLPFVEQFVASYRILQSSRRGPVESAADRAEDLAAELASRFAAHLAPALTALSAAGDGAEESETAPIAEQRAEAEELFERLVLRSEEERRFIVRKGRRYRSAALCERLCDESVDAAAKSAEDSLAWARLALRVAERLPGPGRERSKGLGYAWSFLGNARRVANEFPAADAAFARSRTFYAVAGDAAPGWFDEARALDLEASLRRNWGDFGQALALLDQALAVCQPANRTRILLNQASTLEQDGRPDRALLALAEARPAIERGEGGLRFRCVLHFNTVKNLIQLGRATEAEPWLPELRRITAELNNDLDKLRLRWLEGAVQADLGHRPEALAQMARIRAEFAALSLPADAALVGLHEAEILLLDDRTGKVRALVRAMGPIFESLGLQREALAAYRLFVAAVEREAATVSMARELAKAIERAGARLEGSGAG